MSKNSSSTNALTELLVSVKRVSKVVEGGRRFSFTACVVVGDTAGMYGVGKGKSSEVMDAKNKALNQAKKNMRRIPLFQMRTLHHDVTGKSGAARVLIRKAKPGTGVIAGGAMRAIFTCLGVRDVVAKSFGSSSPYVMAAATLNALSKIRSPKVLSDFRNKKVSEVFVK